MDAYTPEEMEKAKAALPPIVREYLESEELQRALFNIGTFHRLNLAEINIFTHLVMATIAGIQAREAFSTNLARMLPGHSSAFYEVLLIEIDRWVFQKLKDRVTKSNTEKE